MKILAVVESKHQGNTRKVAEAMKDAAPITVTDVENAGKHDLSGYDIVGFGSGIYYGKFDKDLTAFVENLCDKKAYTFIFSTSGTGDFEKNNKPLADLLEKKNKVVLGSFGCKGHDKFLLFRIIGGLNKGRPNAEDLKKAQKFILDIITKYEKVRDK